MTNEEAKKKWCPMVRLIVHPKNYLTTNRITDDSVAPCNCIADECALWVKADLQVGHGWCGLTQAWR
jgi:hypothetical protein